MKKHYFFISIAILAFAILVSCFINLDEEKTIGTGFIETAKFNVHPDNPQRVIHTVDIEQGVDPRVAMGYRLLDDDTPWFDHVVQLYGLRLTNRDCSRDSSVMNCDLADLHICMPLDIIFDEEYAQGFATGIINGEEVSLSGYPVSMYPGSGLVAWRTGGENILRFAHELNVAIFGEDYDKWSAEHEGISSLPRNRLIQQVYETRYGTYLPDSFTYPADHHRFPGKTVYREDIFDTYYIAYSHFPSPPRNSGTPRVKVSPFSVDLGFRIRVHPGPGWDNGGGILPRTGRHLQGNFGVIHYYFITSRAWTLTMRPPDYFGSGPLETYLSQIGEILHSTGVKFTGPDFY